MRLRFFDTIRICPTRGKYVGRLARNIEQALGEVDASLNAILRSDHKREQDLQHFGMFDLLPCQAMQQMLALETFGPARVVPSFLLIFNSTAKVQAYATSL